MSKRASLVRVGVAYVVAVVVGAAWLWLGPDTTHLWLDGLIADTLATLVIFGFSRAHHNSSFYDAWWSVLPPLLAVYWWAAGPLDVGDVRCWLVLGVILVWAVRLTGNWIYAFPGFPHEDWRYPLLREGKGRMEPLVDLFGIHLVPTWQVFLGMTPVYVALTRSGRDVGWIDALAVVIGLGAVALELAADTQMYRFARTKQPGQCMDQGLWGWSRHPNYFGEISFWFALGLFGLAASPADWWWVFIGTIAMAALFLGASIPMMEQRSLERRPAYQDVIDRVPRLVPRPPAGPFVTRPRVVVAGLGDTGLLTARHLSRHVDVVGISSKPALVSGQELGMRLARPDEWAREYLVEFDRYRRLDRVRTVHGTLTGLSLGDRTVAVRLPDGTTSTEPYDVLVISTGVTNGFWRRPDLQSDDDVDAALRAAHEQLAAAGSINVIGGGAAAVNAAANLALAWPDARVALYYPGERALPQHHGRVWAKVSGILEERGVSLHPGHRAVVPAGFDLDRITTDPVAFSTGQPDALADATLWAIGRVRPNTGWLPDSLLDEGGFVRVAPDLTVVGAPGVFSIGDIAATDPLRGSARNRADRLLARNIRRHLAGRPLGHYRPRRRRWGSVLGFQPDGLRVFTPSGRSFRFPAWTIQTVLQPWIVRRGIYGGVRRRR